jgi:hypothetical protein
MTVGINAVAFFAASFAGVVIVTITSTLEATSSAAAATRALSSLA